MFIKLKLYGLYLRIAGYVAAIVAVVLAAKVWSFASPTSMSGMRAGTIWELLVLTVLVWALVAEACGFFELTGLQQEFTGIRVVTETCFTTYSILLLILFLTHNVAVSRMLVVLSATFLLACEVGARYVARVLIANRASHRKRNRVLVIGADRFARSVSLRIEREAFPASTIFGFVLLEGQENEIYQHRVYCVADLDEFPVDGSIDEIVMAVPLAQLGNVSHLIPKLQRLCVPIRAAVNTGQALKIRSTVITLGDVQILNLANTTSESMRYLVIKRAFDIGFSVFALILSFPLLCIIAIGIKLTSRGPIFFTQERVGLNGRIFKMVKFRTMRVSTGKVSDLTWTTSNDPRKTRFGSLLRKTSLDELPQFWNVFKGQMSVVGPRPERPHFVRQFDHEYNQYSQRHSLKVGITGWAQVNGYRGDTSIKKRIQHDLYYLQNWSLGLDLQILARTIFTGLLNNNAY
jgi:Undecaprenyl-phosphate glucose phosphotransferase